MSYTYLIDPCENSTSSPAVAVESSAASFSDIPPSVLSRLNLTAEKSCCNGNGMESCQGSRYGMTCEISTESRGEEGSMLSRAGSLVRTSAAEKPTVRPESQESEAGSGKKWPESLAKYDPNSHSWKTRQCSLLGGLEPFLETWPNWGLMLAGESYQQPMRAPHISESEFGFLPTPDASLGKYAVGAATDFVSCFRKMESGTRPSGAKIGSSLRWHQEFIHEWQRTGGELNAEWIEVLMGWPIGMTDLQPLEMAKFQQWLNSHGKP